MSPETKGHMLKLKQPTGTWFIHNKQVIINQSCNICGDDNCCNYIDGRCWKCWRSLNPGTLQ